MKIKHNNNITPPNPPLTQNLFSRTRETTVPFDPSRYSLLFFVNSTSFVDKDGEELTSGCDAQPAPIENYIFSFHRWVEREHHQDSCFCPLWFERNQEGWEERSFLRCEVSVIAATVSENNLEGKLG
jgi:hypothetical protein